MLNQLILKVPEFFSLMTFFSELHKLNDNNSKVFLFDNNTSIYVSKFVLFLFLSFFYHNFYNIFIVSMDISILGTNFFDLNFCSFLIIFCLKKV